MNLTFKEKGLWLMLIALVTVYGSYFSKVLPTASINVSAQQMSLFISAVVSLIVILIVGYSVIGATAKEERTDERDALVLLKGSSISSYVLSGGIFLSIWVGLQYEGNFLITHCLLFTLVLSEIVDICVQLYQYRRWA